MAEPWKKYQQAPQNPNPGFQVYGAPDPYKISEERRENDAAERASREEQRKAAAEAVRLKVDQEKLALDRQRLEFDRNKDKPQPLTPQQMADIRVDAANKINTIRSIRKRLKENDGLMGIDLVPETGLLGQVASKVGGTRASDIAADIDTLKAGGALTEVARLIKETGKNPFTPMSNYETELLSGNIGNLTLNQSRDNLIKHLGNYEKAYSRAFVGAKGKPEALRAAPRKQRKLPPGWSIEEVR